MKPKIGQYVKVMDWVGRIEDVAISESRTMILVCSPKGIWLNHPTEWIEYDEKRVELATRYDIQGEIDKRRELIRRMLDRLDSFEGDVWIHNEE